MPAWKASKARGLTPIRAADKSVTDSEYFTLSGPDCNPILIDQHVPSPAIPKK